MKIPLRISSVNVTKFTVLEPVFNKVAGLRPATLLKRDANTVDLVTFSEEILNGNFSFCAVLRGHSNLVFPESHMNVSCIFDSVFMEQGTMYILSTFQMFVYLYKVY